MKDSACNRYRSYSRSESPVPTKHKRSWQPSSATGGRSSGSREIPAVPIAAHRDHFKPRNNKFGGRKDFGGEFQNFRRSRSPRNSKKHRPKSPALDRGRSPSKFQGRERSPPKFQGRERSPSKFQGRENGRATSKFRPRSQSPPPPPKNFDRGRDEQRFKRRSSGSPDGGPPMKKKLPRYSPARDISRSLSPLPKKKLAGPYSPIRDMSKSLSPLPVKKKTGNAKYRESVRNMSRSKSPVGNKKFDSRKRETSPSPKQKNSSKSFRKVNVSEKKKPSRITLNSRFTPDDQEPFRLIENVTIAILRNPNAEASEEVTVKRVFDASLFKMVHKKMDGKKPIFDREEIKIWRHDDNLADDPDFERRLVRVKSSATSAKTAKDSLSRMSPETLRKTFGLQIGDRSRSREKEPQIRLDPKPDPRYESKYRQQIEREEVLVKRKKEGDTRNVESERKSSHSSKERRKSKEQLAKKEEDRKANAIRKREVHDLRQALEKRRNDREETAGFRVEIRRGERPPSTELYYREQGQQQGRDRLGHDDGRNVVVDEDRVGYRRSGSNEREFRPWDDNRRGFRGRGRGGPRGNRGRGDGWMIDRNPREMDNRGNRGRGNRQNRFYGSMSPPPHDNNRGGWRGNFRGRGGRGRGRDFEPFDKETALATAQEMDDRNKFLQHDDRDVSPQMFRGRGGRGRFVSRGFGSSSFRGNNRGFRGNFRGRRGNFRNNFNNDQMDRGRDISLEREWKHDMYDSLQAEEQPHSTTGGN